MSQTQECEDCQEGKHHYAQDVKECYCRCSDLVQGNHLQESPKDISDSKPSI